MQSRLTPFRKTRRQKAESRNRQQLDCLDAAQDHCQAIQTLGGLLMGCHDDMMDGGLVRGAGALIDQEARKLNAALAQIQVAP